MHCCYASTPDKTTVSRGASQPSAIATHERWCADKPVAVSALVLPGAPASVVGPGDPPALPASLRGEPASSAATGARLTSATSHMLAD